MSNKCKGVSEDLVLIEGQVINDQRNVSDMLNEFYINVTSHIGTPDAIKENDSVSEIVEHHCNHPSIEFIKNNVESMDTVVFDLVSIEETQIS